MGYMGFGMKKGDELRKPRQGHEHLKKIYGEGFERMKRSVDTDPTETDFDELLRMRFAHERRYHAAAKVVGVFAAVGVIFLLLWVLYAAAVS